jgi:hypothetical protein
MTTDTEAVVLPLRPSKDEPNAQSALRATRARPDDVPAGPPAAPGMTAAKGTGRGYSARLAGVQAAMSGASLIDAPMPSLSAVWAKHRASAEWYSAGALRWPRYAYAGLHMLLAVLPLRFIEWATDSPPKLLTATATILVTLWLLHVI